MSTYNVSEQCPLLEMSIYMASLCLIQEMSKCLSLNNIPHRPNVLFNVYVMPSNILFMKCLSNAFQHSIYEMSI